MSLANISPSNTFDLMPQCWNIAVFLSTLKYPFYKTYYADVQILGIHLGHLVSF